MEIKNGTPSDKRLRLLLAVTAAALLLSFPQARVRTAGLSLVPAASAQFSSSPAYSADDDDPIASAIRDFLKAHGTLFFTALPAVMLVVYVLIMGPAEVGEAYRYTRRNRYGGFGSDGGFGGRAGF